MRIVLVMFAMWLIALPALADVVFEEKKTGGSVALLRVYYQDGRVIAKRGYDGKGALVLYENEIPDGPVKSFYADGQLESEGTFQDGKYAGALKRYYPDGMLRSNINFVNGMAEGQCQHYHPNGALMSVENYVQNRREGEALYYDESGTLAEKRIYALGVCETREPVRPFAPPPREAQSLDMGREAWHDPAGLRELRFGKTGMQGTVVLAGNWLYAAWDMSDVNDYMDAWNDVMAYYGQSKLPALHDGAGMGLDLAWWAGDQFVLGAGIESMANRSECGDETLGVVMEFSALEVSGMVKWAEKIGDHIFYAGLGLCYVEMIHCSEYDYLNAIGYYDQYRSFSGSAVGYKVGVDYDVKWTDAFGVGVSLGYRSAKITAVRFTAREQRDEKFEKLDGGGASVDFSGFYFKGGLRIYL